jgi:hypothetical protein
MFQKYILTNNTFNFVNLSNSVRFEDITNGRKGANIVDVKDNELIPLVRTTTIYKQPCQTFSNIHYELVNKIKSITNNYSMNLNNALVEIYNNNYTTMGYHSDQALDLEEDSYICLYSVYNEVEKDKQLVRYLKIQNKLTNEEQEITLEHNSIVIFSTNINKQFLHKILLKNTNNIKSNKQWLGITFRCSKTFIKFINEIPYFVNNINTNNNTNIIIHQLYLANEVEKKEFFKLRGLENRLIEFKYPTIYFTINPSELIKY